MTTISWHLSILIKYILYSSAEGTAPLPLIAQAQGSSVTLRTRTTSPLYVYAYLIVLVHAYDIFF